MVITVFFTHHHKVFWIENDVGVGFFFNVLGSFITYHQFTQCTSWIGKVEVETVLMTVQSHDCQRILIIRKLDARDITVCI